MIFKEMDKLNDKMENDFLETFTPKLDANSVLETMKIITDDYAEKQKITKLIARYEDAYILGYKRSEKHFTEIYGKISDVEDRIKYLKAFKCKFIKVLFRNNEITYKLN